LQKSAGFAGFKRIDHDRNFVAHGYRVACESIRDHFCRAAALNQPWLCPAIFLDVKADTQVGVSPDDLGDRSGYCGGFASVERDRRMVAQYDLRQSEGNKR
jgi:hypothetical protein